MLYYELQKRKEKSAGFFCGGGEEGQVASLSNGRVDFATHLKTLNFQVKYGHVNRAPHPLSKYVLYRLLVGPGSIPQDAFIFVGYF